MRIVLTLGVVLIGTTVAMADVIATFQGTSPFEAVNTNIQGETTLGNPVGPFNFNVVSSSDSRFAGSFTGFCADLRKDVSPGNTYTYQVTSIGVLPTISQNANKVLLIQELYDKFYSVANDAVRGGAFQILQWEIIYDGANGASGLDIDSGDFRLLGDHNADTGLPAGSYYQAKSWVSEFGVPYGNSTYQVVGLYNETAQDQLTAFKIEPQAVPAPPAVILGAIAMGVFGVRRYSARRSIS